MMITDMMNMGIYGYDPHIWLDPSNAKVIVKKITNQLSKIDKDNSSV